MSRLLKLGSQLEGVRLRFTIVKGCVVSEKKKRSGWENSWRPPSRLGKGLAKQNPSSAPSVVLRGIEERSEEGTVVST